MPWIELSEKQFTTQMTRQSAYTQLKQSMGERHARASVASVFLKLNNKGQVSVNKDTQADFWKQMNAMLQHELNCVLNGHYHIGSLLIKARTSSFAQEMDQQTMTPDKYGALAADADLLKAAKWLCNSSTSLKGNVGGGGGGGPISISKVQGALDHVVNSGMSVQDVAFARYLHAEVVDQAKLPKSRGISTEAKYPSIGGGRFLLESTFNLARGYTLPKAGSELWIGYGSFLFGGLVRSHGFTDGNGRVARAAYACARIKGGVPFAALTVEAEKKLSELA